MKHLEESIREIACYFSKIELINNLIIVEKSTVPVKTSIIIKEIFEKNQILYPLNSNKLSIISNPEFLAEDKPKILIYIYII